MTRKRLFVALLKPWRGGYEIHLSEVVFPRSGDPPISADVGVTQCQRSDDETVMRTVCDYLELRYDLDSRGYDVAVLSFVWEDLC